MPDPNSELPSVTMLNLITGLWVTQAIYVAAELRIADLIYGEPQSCDALAETTEVDAGALYRLLRALAGLGIFSEGEDGRFRLTPLGECLRSDAPGSLRAFALMLGGEEQRRSWGEALHSVRTGEPAFAHVFGKPHFQYFAEHPEAARIFNEAMTSRSGSEDDAVISNYDFSRHETIVDVGGGQGSLLTAILGKFATTRGILFDMSHAISTARDVFSGSSDADRLSFQDGDFFDSVPAGGDAYILKKVIHNWDDARAKTILSNCRDAMAEHGRLLLIEPVIPRGNTPSFNKVLDLMMLVYTSMGKIRTEAEHRALLASSGFKLDRATDTNALVKILEAVPD